MKKNILILLSDPESINYEIVKKSVSFFKRNNKNIYTFVGCKKDFEKNVTKKKLNTNFINIDRAFNTKKYLEECFMYSFKLLKEKKAHGIINLPLNKKNLPKKYPGFTEYIASYFNKRGKETMLLYNSKFSVCPNTTHIQVKDISKKLTKKLIIKNALNIKRFYNNIVKIKNPKLIHMGLNPHSGVDFKNTTEEKKIIVPAINYLKKKRINIKGPISPDIAFKNNKFNCIIGNYHDQVLPTFKYIFDYNAINITLGLPFLRISPDHGTAKDQIGKNTACADSFKMALLFFEKFCHKL